MRFHRRHTTRKRIGFFGLLGSGNLGNDTSFESALRYIQRAHPEAQLDAMCMGPDRVREDFGLPAIQVQWSQTYEARVSPGTRMVLKALGKGIDVVRTLRWVRRHDIVIVPGMGVMEKSLPIRASGIPWTMFLLGFAGAVCKRKVALISVGATPIGPRITRRLFDTAARMASYRSYRDWTSRQAMADRGVDVSRDDVYPDLVFGLDVPACADHDPNLVAVGVMAYYGNTNDRRRQEAVYRRYLTAMTSLVGWLVDTGHRVRLFVGDFADDVTVQQIIRDTQASRPGLSPEELAPAPCRTLQDQIRGISPASIVVGTRYHNVLVGLRLAKPMLSVGYSTKHHTVMENLGLADFSLSANDIDGAELISTFKALEQEADVIRKELVDRVADQTIAVNGQFAVISELIRNS